MNQVVMSKPGVGQAGQLRAAAGVPAGSPRIVVDGVALAVSRQGKGPPLVCLHATGHGGGDFTALEGAVSRVRILRWPGGKRSYWMYLPDARTTAILCRSNSRFGG